MTLKQTLAKAGPVSTSNRMNDTEAAFSRELDAGIIRGKMKRWWFNQLSFQLPGRQNWYKPDFAVVMADDTIAMYDVKGSWSMHGQDRQKIKLKVAGAEFPIFRWFAVQKKTKKSGGGWSVTEFTDVDEPT